MTSENPEEATLAQSVRERQERFLREHEEWNRKVEQAIGEMKEALAELERAEPRR